MEAPMDASGENKDAIGFDRQATQNRLLDAADSIDLDQVENAWKETLIERRTLEAETQRTFRNGSGSSTPSSVVESAEGHVLFPGLQVNSNGALNKVTRAALQESFHQSLGIEGTELKTLSDD
jgi:hypothetical protein